MSGDQCIAACQFEPVIDDITSNIQTIDQTLTSLPSRVAVAVFPELCVTGYDLNVASRRAVPVPGDLTDQLTALAADHDMTIVAGVPERDGEELYNALVIVDGDGVRDVYRKQYSWGDESDVFATGDGPTTVNTGVGTIGFALCYDLNFPEMALDYASQDCDILAVSSAWRASYETDWRLLLRARALDGPYYVVGANHVGSQRGRAHAGQSLVADPSGSVLSKVSDGNGHVVVPIKREKIVAGKDRNPVRESRGWS